MIAGSRLLRGILKFNRMPKAYRPYSRESLPLALLTDLTQIAPDIPQLWLPVKLPRKKRKKNSNTGRLKDTRPRTG